MRPDSLAVSAVALAAAMSFTAPVSTAAADRQVPAGVAACAMGSEAGGGARTARECETVGSLLDWYTVDVDRGRVHLVHHESQECLTAKGKELSRTPCEREVKEQLWSDFTLDGVYGGFWYKNVADSEVCAHVTNTGEHGQGSAVR